MKPFTSYGTSAEHPDKSSSVQSGSSTKLLWAAVALILLYAVLDGVAQVLPPHYSPISQAESDLAVGPYGYVMTINFVNRGVLSLFFVFGFVGALRQAGESLGRYRGGLMLLGTWGIGAFLLAAFPTDVPSTPVSWHGAIHLVVALVAFVAGGLGTLWVSLRVGSDPVLRGAKNFAAPISIVAAVSLVLLFGTLSGPTGGLVERVFIGSVLLWELATSIYLIRSANVRAGRRSSGYTHLDYGEGHRPGEALNSPV